MQQISDAGSTETTSIYLDQNAVSNLARQSNWEKSAIGKKLLSPPFEVWVSPSHYIETMQANDDELRINLSRTILRLADGIRMLPSWEFIVVYSFIRELQATETSSIRTLKYFHYHEETNIRLYLGALALQTLGYNAPPEPVAEIEKIKLVNQSIHSKAAASLGEWLEGLLDCITDMKLSANDPLAPLNSMTTQELRDAIKRDREEYQGVEKDVRRKLQKWRAQIAAAYGAVEIGDCLKASLPIDLEIDLTFNSIGVAKALQKWGVSQKIPEENEALEEAHAILQRAILACKERKLIPGTISNEVVLRQIELAASSKETPNCGAVFDADHAVYLSSVNVFVTDDKDFKKLLQPIANRVSEETGKKTVVCSSNELIKKY